MWRTKDQVSRLSEADFRRLVLVPLLNKLGFMGVFEFHGGRELGKDIVAWQANKLGNRENIAVVAKADKISGTQGSGAVAGQVRQALNAPYADPHTGESLKVNKVTIMTNKSAPEVARAQVRAHLEDHIVSRLDMMDIDDLWPLIEKHLAEGPHEALSRAEAALGAVDSPYEIDLGLRVERDASGQSRRVRVATVRASESKEVDEEELKGRFEIRIPSSPENETFLEDWNMAMSTGAKITVPSEYLNVTLPKAVKDVARDYFGLETLEDLSLEIGSWDNPKTMPINIILTDTEGQSVELPFIEWKITQSGSDVTTMSNVHQDVGITVELVVDQVAQKANLSMAIREQSHTPASLLRLLEFENLFSGPCFIEIFSWELGMNVFSSSRDGGTGTRHTQEAMDFVQDLAKIQAKIGAPIAIPSGKTLKEDAESIRFMRILLHNGEVESSWTTAEIKILAKDVEDIIRDINDLQGRPMRMFQTGKISLLGYEIDLGPQETLLLNPRIADEALARADAAAALPDDLIAVAIEANGIGRVLERFELWKVTDSVVSSPDLSNAADLDDPVADSALDGC